MFQELTLVGNLGKDPEGRYTPAGTFVASLNVATNRKYTNGEGTLVKETTWFRVSVFGKQGEACAEYLKKGASVLVKGRLTSDQKTGGPKTFTRADGSVGAAFEVFADTVRFLSGNGGGSHDEPPADDGETGGEAKDTAQKSERGPSDLI